MNVLTKVILKLWKNSKILAYSLLTSQEKKLEDSQSRFIWNRAFASKCGTRPTYFPRRREITDTSWGNFFLLTPFFVWLSYRKINQKLKKNNTIFVSLNEMGTFIKQVLPKIKTPFVLVTGESDYSTEKFKEILKNKYLIHWFAQNNTIKSKKITSLPLGLDFHTLLTEESFKEKKMSAEEQEKRLEQVRKLKVKQKLKVFTNFHLSYTSQRRKELHKLLKENPNFYFQKKKLPRTKMWKLQKGFVFNFSPGGNGFDTHRVWEALILGQIPIVEKTNTPLDEMYKEFPIVVIKSLSEINKGNLKKWKKKYSGMFDKNLETKLTNNYGIKQIQFS